MLYAVNVLFCNLLQNVSVYGTVMHQNCTATGEERIRTQTISSMDEIRRRRRWCNHATVMLEDRLAVWVDSTGNESNLRWSDALNLPSRNCMRTSRWLRLGNEAEAVSLEYQLRPEADCACLIARHQSTYN